MHRTDNFWHKLKRPFFVLAPMEDVTDAAFRRIVAKYGKPDVIFTEFASVDGIVSENGRERILEDLKFDESERPVVAQLFGSKPANFYQSAKIVSRLGFDGIDINMGCPDKAIVKQGAGAALIREPALAAEIIAAAKEGAGERPVSIKTRIGFNQINEYLNWIPALLKAQPAALTIHGRTKKEMSKVPNHWEIIGQIAKMTKDSGMVIIGNGDVNSIDEAKSKADNFGVDGVMIGRGVFGNPWFFNPKVKKENLSLKEVLEVLIEHTKLFEKLLGDTRHFILMRKHFSSYLKGYNNIKELKLALMETTNSNEVKGVIGQFQKML